MITTRAAVLDQSGLPKPYAKSKPLTIREFELDAPGSGEVLVKIGAAGLCHSDLSVIDGSRPRPCPMVLGHEAAGMVEMVGPDVDDLSIGDKVVMVFVPSCGHCVPCAEGRPALCEPAALANNDGVLISGARRLRFEGQTVNHHLGISAFSEYAVVSRNSVVRIDGDLGFDEAALFGCAVVTGVGAVVNTADVKAGSSVAVLGLGGVGMNAVLGAKLAGAAQIVAIDLVDTKLDLAKNLGATEVFLADASNVVEAIREATGGGADYTFEMAGSVAALKMAWAITRRGGMTVTAGLPHPQRHLDLQAVQIVAEERTLKGSYLGSCVPVRDIPRYIDLYRKGKLAVDGLMGDVLDLTEINAAFDRLAAGATTRQIISFDMS